MSSASKLYLWWHRPLGLGLVHVPLHLDGQRGVGRAVEAAASAVDLGVGAARETEEAALIERRRLAWQKYVSTENLAEKR